MEKAIVGSGFGTLASLAVLLVAAARAEAQTGLRGEYFGTESFSGASLNRLDATVNFATFNPADFPDNSDDTLSVRWVGTVVAPGTGVVPINVTFYVRTDDGGRCWVNGEPVVDQWRDQGIPGPPGPSGVIALVPGREYAIVVEMYERGGGEGCILEWSYPGQAQQVIPTGNLLPKVPVPQLSVTGGTLTNVPAVSVHCPVPGVALTFDLGGGPQPYVGPVVIPSGSSTLTVTGTRPLLTNGQAMATYTVNDSTVPGLAMVQSHGATLVRVVYREPVTAASAQNLANYTFTPAVALTGATLQYDQQTVLVAGPFVTDTPYQLRVLGVQDRATPANTVPAVGEFMLFTHRPWRETNLVDWYRCDERTGLTLNDTSGSGTGGNNGTLPAPLADNTGPYFVESGKFLGALFFDGENDVVTVSNMQPVLGAGNASVAAWVRTRTRAGPSNNPWELPGLIGTEVGGTDDIFYGLFNQTGQILMHAGDVVVSTPTVVNNWQWHHVVFTWEMTTGTVNIFVNGAANSGTPATTQVGPKTSALTTLGKPGASQFWCAYAGAMDEMRIYNALLTQPDALNLANTIPTVTAGGPAGSINPTQTANLTATHAPDDGIGGNAITYLWAQISGPGGATIATPTAQNTSVTFTTAGLYVFRITITDGHLVTSDDVTVDVSPITVSPTSGLVTSEPNGSDSFTVTLFNPLTPGQTVTIPVSSSDTTEAQPTQGGPPITQLVFDDTNWNIPQSVIVVGQDDALVDGPQPFTIVLGVVTGPGAYSGLNPPDVTGTNNDDDIPAVLISQVTGLITTESGGTAQFTVRLQTQPASNVTINFASTNTAEGTVAPPSVIFTSGNWMTAVPVTITGVDDTVIDFDIQYFITTTVTTTDADYTGMNPPDPAVINQDNEVIPPAPEAWGNCGWLGLEVLLPLAWAAWRRRRRRPPM